MIAFSETTRDKSMARIDSEIGETLNMTARFSGVFSVIAALAWFIDLLVHTGNATDVDQRPFFQRPAGKTTEAFLIITLITLMLGATRCIYLDRQRSNNRDNDYLAISSDDESATSSDDDSENNAATQQANRQALATTQTLEAGISIPRDTLERLINNFALYGTHANNNNTNTIEIVQRSNTPSNTPPDPQPTLY